MPNGSWNLGGAVVRHGFTIAGGLLSQFLGGGTFYTVGLVVLGGTIDQWRLRRKVGRHGAGHPTPTVDHLIFPSHRTRFSFYLLVLAGPLYSVALYLLAAVDPSATDALVTAASAFAAKVSSGIPSLQVLHTLRRIGPGQTTDAFSHLILIGFLLSLLGLAAAVALFLRNSSHVADRVLSAHAVSFEWITLIAASAVAAFFWYQLAFGGSHLLSSYQKFGQGATSELLVLGMFFGISSYCSALAMISAGVLYRNAESG